MKLKEKEQARSLRMLGRSINQIVHETGLSKSSVSNWVRDIVLSEVQKKNITHRGRSVDSIEKRRLNRLNNERAKRSAIVEKAKTDYKHISKSQLKLIGIILYLGEGGKSGRGAVRLSNSDPAVIKIMMRFFREVCGVPEKKFRGCIHAFEHTDIGKVEKFWSEITKISLKQFYKTYVKPSSVSLHKRNSLPYGTLDIYVCDTKLFLTIMGWIDKIKDIVASPVDRKD